MSDAADVQLTLVLQQLWVSATSSLYEEQPERFEVVGGYDLPLPNDPLFASGTMFWCDCTANMLLLRSYEQGRGHTVTVLWDLNEAAVARREARPHAAYVVLSSRDLATSEHER